jgi:hypothetical protein
MENINNVIMPFLELCSAAGVTWCRIQKLLVNTGEGIRTRWCHTWSGFTLLMTMTVMMIMMLEPRSVVLPSVMLLMSAITALLHLWRFHPFDDHDRNPVILV